MTREELRQEAEERATKFTDINFNEPDNYGSEKEVGHFSYYTGYLASAEPREKRILELDKENGKLEGRLEDERMEYIELENFKNNEIAELKEQLAKAKEIIQTLIESLEVSEGEEAIRESKVIKEIEQFLKGVE